MAKTYVIKRIDSKDIDSNIWEVIEPAHVDIFSWDENGYRPKTEAKVFYTESAIHIKFKSYEDKIEAVYTNMNDPVYMDSCVEFFINPMPDKDNRYLNFETNCIGVLNLGIGSDRYDRVKVDECYFPMF